MWYEADLDALMKRTAQRPLPAGRMDRQSALHFGVGLAFFSVSLMELATNRVAAFILALSILFYVLVYTIWLKRRTPQNIVIGGAAGAAPPLLGWVAITNDVHAHALILFLIIFVWTPPHFWALAIERRDEYAKVQIPMLPVTHGIDFTRTQVLLYTILLVAVTMLPFATGMSGAIYLAGALVLGAIFLWYAARLKFAPVPGLPMKTFGYSIVYLMGIFTLLLVDHYLRV
jgi:protoheme IX farnesyltransferase